MVMTEHEPTRAPYPGRRALVRGAAGVVGAGGLAATVTVSSASSIPMSASTDGRVPFHGAHQAGILTRQQPFGGFVAFDVLARDRAELQALFTKLTARCRALTAGVTPKNPEVAALRDPQDRLTITVGVGASLFDERYGLQGARPPGLVNMPLFPGDRLGTAHPDTASKREMNRLVWVGHEGPAWARGGSYQVLRIIGIHAEKWDRVPVAKQEQIFGRRKATGAPLDGRKESDLPDYGRDQEGRITPLDSHIRRANPRTPESENSILLRRSYNTDRGLTPDGTLDVGLIFCCYQRDIARQFATVQKRLEGERFADFS
ncbi:peroxidase, partial [Streptomyces albus subsp. albus]